MVGALLSRYIRRTDWDGTVDSLPFLPGIPARYYRGALCGWACIADCCSGHGIGMRWISLDSTRKVYWASQPRRNFYLSRAD